MIALDSSANMPVDTSTNGLRLKIPSGVSDTKQIGSGAYVDNEVAAASAAGNGDIMQRFVPSYHIVELMREGSTREQTCLNVIQRIAKFYPKFSGALLALNKYSHHNAAWYSMNYFPYSVMQQGWPESTVIEFPCLGS